MAAAGCGRWCTSSTPHRPRAWRERYVGEWLPEPLVTDPTPAELAETVDSLSLAFLVLLESLSPRQRAAFLLREVFEYPYTEIAGIIGTGVDGTRHLVARARDQVRERRPRYYASRRQRHEPARRFFAAVEQGDLPALGRPVNGRKRVAKIMLAGMSAVACGGGVRIQVAEVNSRPGAMVFDAWDRLVGVSSWPERSARPFPAE